MIIFEQFLRYQAFYEVKGVGHAWAQPREFPELLNVSYHKKQEYIWFRGGDLNGFGDIRTLRIGWAWACLQGIP